MLNKFLLYDLQTFINFLYQNNNYKSDVIKNQMENNQL